MIDRLRQVREHVDATAIAAAHDSIEDWIRPVVFRQKAVRQQFKTAAVSLHRDQRFPDFEAWRR